MSSTMPPEAVQTRRRPPPHDVRNSSHRPGEQSARQAAGNDDPNTPLSFFRPTSEELESMASSTPDVQDSTYGVRSIDSTTNSSIYRDSVYELAGAGAGIDPSEASSRPTSRSDSPFLPNLAQRYVRGSSTGSSPIPPTTRNTGSLTPLLLRSPVHGSVTDSAPMSTPNSVSLRSLRLSDDEDSVDEAASQALTSSGEDEEAEEVDETMLADGAQTESLPQLVMPSISMPRRRPFTERGKNIGKLKIMFAGSKGTGKSSLIRSMVQICKEIVHVDSLTPTSSTLTAADMQRSSSRHTERPAKPSQIITEIPASTRAYPAWWTELDESRVLRKRRRSSVNEPVLERNVCFIDTQSDHTLQNVVQHVEGLFWRNQSFTSYSDSELLSIFSGNGGVQVDVVLYLLKGTPSAAEIVTMKRLADLTNLIPLIAHADTLSASETTNLQRDILQTLSDADIRPFFFGESVNDAILRHDFQYQSSHIPYTISCAPATDLESMDSSLLMDPDHNTSNLQPSDLSFLVFRLFDPDTTAWLRHLSARKFLQWRRDTLGQLTVTADSSGAFVPPTGLGILSGFPLPTFTTNSNIVTSTLNSSLNQDQPQFRPRAHTTIPPVPPYPSIGTSSPYTSARLADHTLRSERLTQLRLARWASDLQRSLRSERERYAALQRGERRRWLEERMRECDEVDAEAAESKLNRGMDGSKDEELEIGLRAGMSEKSLQHHHQHQHQHDPLNLLAWDDTIRQAGGWVVLEVAGACGVLGALAVWAVRSWTVWKGMSVGMAGGGMGSLDVMASGVGVRSGGGVGWGFWAE